MTLLCTRHENRLWCKWLFAILHVLASTARCACSEMPLAQRRALRPAQCAQAWHSSAHNKHIRPVHAGASEEDDATELPAAVARATPVVFASMQEVEAFWDQQALHVSGVCSVELTLARKLLKEHGHDVDAAIQGYLVHVRHDLFCCFTATCSLTSATDYMGMTPPIVLCVSDRHAVFVVYVGTTWKPCSVACRRTSGRRMSSIAARTAAASALCASSPSTWRRTM